MNTNKFSPIRNFTSIVGDGDEPYPSLSDYHDYEPNLEFDDSELQQNANLIAENVDQLHIQSNGMHSPIPHFADDNFEDELAARDEEEGAAGEESLDSLAYQSSYPALDFDTNASSNNSSNRLRGASDAPHHSNADALLMATKFSDVAKYRIVDVKGDDSIGRKIIVVYACRLPPIKKIDHSAFLSYLIHTLDRYVEQDYSLVYFHYGLTSKNKPSLKWLVQAYKAFDRKYKKNLKALYLVHPTNFLKIISQLFRPLISAKFGKKINYIDSLKDLNEHIALEKLDILEEVIQHDRELGGCVSPNIEQNSRPRLLNQQFGVKLQFINGIEECTIPPVVKQCVEYMDKPDALETEGIFRRSPNALKIRQLKEAADGGKSLNFDDAHEAAALLKTFLRELSEPLLTYACYEEIINFQSWNREDQLRAVSILVMEKLPELNYKVLKYIISFLTRVMERSDLNKMNAQNLAVVFGPNLVWSEKESMSLGAIGPINMFTQFLLQHFGEIFII